MHIDEICVVPSDLIAITYTLTMFFQIMKLKLVLKYETFQMKLLLKYAFNVS